MSGTQQRAGLATLSLGALGVVYGDIGTSPLYTIKEIFAESTGILPTPANVIGAISAVFWALMLVVTLKYVVLVLRADNKGEGGIMALLALAVSSVADKPVLARRLLLLGAFGAALFYGDTVITPAISVLSAVEGLEVITPALKPGVIPLSLLILVALFAVQRHGTHRMGRFFGPVIVVWFLVLGVVGIWQISRHPAILVALNPAHALFFLIDRGPGFFLAVGAVVLAITGAEALYADMGHFGRPAIRLAWSALVMPGLALNYLGQGALLLGDPKAIENPFYLAFPDSFLVVAVVLSTLATIIASQAVISGAYSITQQAIQLGLLPRMQIIHTSQTEAGQIYVPTVNWILLGAVLLATVNFRSSSALASAYGIAVTGTMLITTLLTYVVLRHAWRYPLWLTLAATGCFVALDLILLASCSVKFFSGGWFPVLLAFALLTLMWTWKQGRELMLGHIRNDDPKLEAFVAHLGDGVVARLERTAVFLVSDPSTAPQALMHNLKHNQVIHQTNLVVTVIFENQPFIEDADRSAWRSVGEGFWQITLRYGFMETPDIPSMLASCRIEGVLFDPFTTSYFLSRETVVPTAGGGMADWREALFAALSRNAGSVVSYFRIPDNSVIELGTRVQI